MALELATLPLWILAGAALEIEGQHLLVFSLSYTLASILLSPDLDLRRTSVGRRWGPLRVIWVPYFLLFRHRGLSHSLLWGPITRVGYLACLTAAVWCTVVRLSGVSPVIPAVNVHVPALAAGLYFPNTLHVLLDRACSLRYRVG